MGTLRKDIQEIDLRRLHIIPGRTVCAALGLFQEREHRFHRFGGNLPSDLNLWECSFFPPVPENRSRRFD